MAHHDRWLEMLRELADRNGSVELTPIDDSGEGDQAGATAAPTGGPDQTATQAPPQTHTCRARLLEVGRDQKLLVEMPPRPGAAQALRRAAAVHVLVMNHGQRWTGRSPVLGTQRYQLNERNHVLALQLGGTTDVRSAQRRRFYRANTAAIEMPNVLLAAVDDQLAKEIGPLEARMLNISGGGLGLRLEGREVRQVLTGQVYCCRFQLPGDQEGMVVNARIVHAEPTRDRALYLGMSFEFADDAHRQRVQDRIIRFTTRLEREQLQRQRRA